MREVGGSIGVPLYFSRPLGIAMYVFGFREGWLWIFPDHNALLVDMIVFVALFGLAYLSANIAFRVQFAIMGVIAASVPPVTTTSAEPCWMALKASPIALVADAQAVATV